MTNLPAVVNDFRTTKHTVKMMGILPENTYDLHDASHEQMTEFYDWFRFKIAVQSKFLDNDTGICSADLIKGLLWDKIK